MLLQITTQDFGLPSKVRCDMNSCLHILTEGQEGVVCTITALERSLPPVFFSTLEDEGLLTVLLALCLLANLKKVQDHQD